MDNILSNTPLGNEHTAEFLPFTDHAVIIAQPRFISSSF